MKRKRFIIFKKKTILPCLFSLFILLPFWGIAARVSIVFFCHFVSKSENDQQEGGENGFRFLPPFFLITNTPNYQQQHIFELFFSLL